MSKYLLINFSFILTFITQGLASSSTDMRSIRERIDAMNAKYAEQNNRAQNSSFKKESHTSDFAERFEKRRQQRAAERLDREEQFRQEERLQKEQALSRSAVVQDRLKSSATERFAGIDKESALLRGDVALRHDMPKDDLNIREAVNYCEPRVQAECVEESCPRYCEAAYAEIQDPVRRNQKIQDCKASCSQQCSLNRTGQDVDPVLIAQVDDMKMQCIAQARDGRGAKSGRRDINWWDVRAPRYYRLLKLAGLLGKSDINPDEVRSYSSREGMGTREERDDFRDSSNRMSGDIQNERQSRRYEDDRKNDPRYGNQEHRSEFFDAIERRKRALRESGNYR